LDWIHEMIDWIGLSLEKFNPNHNLWSEVMVGMKFAGRRGRVDVNYCIEQKKRLFSKFEQ